MFYIDIFKIPIINNIIHITSAMNYELYDKTKVTDISLLMGLNHDSLVDIMQIYIDNYIYVDYCFLKQSGRIRIRNKIFEEPSKRSLNYLISVLATIKLSHIVLYWTIIILEKLQEKQLIYYDIYSIHYVIPIIYDIGNKLAEDNYYNSRIFMDLMHVTPEYFIRNEITLFSILVENIKPYEVFVDIDPKFSILIREFQKCKILDV